MELRLENLAACFPSAFNVIKLEKCCVNMQALLMSLHRHVLTCNYASLSKHSIGAEMEAK